MAKPKLKYCVLIKHKKTKDSPLEKLWVEAETKKKMLHLITKNIDNQCNLFSDGTPMPILGEYRTVCYWWREELEEKLVDLTFLLRHCDASEKPLIEMERNSIMHRLAHFREI